MVASKTGAGGTGRVRRAGVGAERGGGRVVGTGTLALIISCTR
jgi:hypothetical protein